MTDREPIPAKPITEADLQKTRDVMAKLKEDTPENRIRQQLFDEWIANSPQWQSLIKEFGDGTK